MERSSRVFWVVVVMLLITMSTETGMTKVGEARKCESQSQKFKGVCVSKTNCASVCKTEGFPDGDCRGARRRCFCVYYCAA